ncbi:MAG: SIMPL domain-containing protein [Dehalococcoidales bacterium]
MRWRLLLAICLALVVIAIGMTGCKTLSPPASAPEVAQSLSGIFSQQSTGIWVSGEGKVSVVPDVAILDLGVEVQSDTVAGAQSYAATVMTDVLEELDNQGVAKKDIQTRRFSIYPVRRWSDQEAREVLIGYRVSNTVTAKVREVDDAGAIIDAVAKVGGDYIGINNISFTVDDPTPYHKEVREKAMADAEAKAKQLADLGGVKLGKLTFISEGGPLPVVREAYLEAPIPAPAMAPTPISPGETEIRLTVQVAYSIE